MTLLANRLKRLRQECNLTQTTLGSLGFISVHGWIKLENGQRSPSEKLIENLLAWLVRDQHISKKAAGPLKLELLTLKYLGDPSRFVRDAIGAYARSTPWGQRLLEENTPPPTRKRADKKGAGK